MRHNLNGMCTDCLVLCSKSCAAAAALLRHASPRRGNPDLPVFAGI